MKCVHCDNKEDLKPKKETVNYSPMFLHNDVMIENAKKYTCTKCSQTWHDLGDSDQIDLQIASRMLEQPMINRTQMAWIRRSLLKVSMVEIAYHLGCSVRFVIDLETFRTVLSEPMSDAIKALIEKHLVSRRLLVKESKKKIKLQLW
jgi:hypothetical protein